MSFLPFKHTLLASLRDLGANSKYLEKGARFDELILQYSNTDRVYHNTDHLKFGLHFIETVRKYQSDEYKVPRFRRPDEQSFNEAIVAFMYHDYYCVPGRKDNEQLSIEAMNMDMLEADIALASIQRMNDAIRNTKNIVVSSTDHPVTALVHDADCAILTSPWPLYEKYKESLYNEYGITPDEERWNPNSPLRIRFYRGRLEFLDYAFQHLNFSKWCPNNVTLEAARANFYGETVEMRKDVKLCRNLEFPSWSDWPSQAWSEHLRLRS